MSDEALVFQQVPNSQKVVPNRASRRIDGRSKVRCDQCRLPVKLYNYDRHFARVHPTVEAPSPEDVNL